MIHQIGFIADSNSFENLKPYTHNLPLNALGYAQISDFEKDGELDLDLLKSFANRLEAVVVCQSSHLISQILSQLIKWGKHVLIFDNIVDILNTISDLPKLIAESRTVFQFANMERNKPVYTSLRQYIKRGKYCKIERWTNQKQNLQQLLAQDIDMALHCFQTGIKNISCTTNNIFGNQIDMINLKVDFNNGASSDILLHATASDEKVSGLFIDTDAYYKVNFDTHEIIEIRNAKSTQLNIDGNIEPNAIVENQKKVMQFEPVKKEFMNFAENISYGFTPLANIDDAQKIAYVMQKANDIMHRNCVSWA